MKHIEITPEVENIIQEAQKLGIADEVQIRNLRLRDAYYKLRKTETYDDAIYKLSKEYGISFSSTETAISGRKKRKKVFKA